MEALSLDLARQVRPHGRSTISNVCDSMSKTPEWRINVSVTTKIALDCGRELATNGTQVDFEQIPRAILQTNLAESIPRPMNLNA